MDFVIWKMNGWIKGEIMNEKFTKKDILSALGLYAIIVVLIVSVCFTAKMLGIPEFQGLF